MPGYLAEIVAHHRTLAAADGRRRSALEAAAAGLPPCRPFAGSLVAAERPAVIAEIKRRSPSKGPLAPALDPARTAVAYESGGASCVSVLTDERYFGGSPADLVAARAACRLPVLRKDFTVSPLDCLDARLMGADAVLLIVAALCDAELRELHGVAEELGLAALVEVHDEAELDRALAAGASLVGVNQRDLHTFAVDAARAERVRAAIPPGVVSVAESGIAGAQDLARLADAGFDAVLVGEALVTAPDPGEALATLRSGTRALRPARSAGAR